MQQGHYLCGCDPNNERIKSYTTSIDPVTQQLTSKRYDSQGFEVCPIHGKRLYGWNGIKKQGPQGNTVTDWQAEAEDLYGTASQRELGALKIKDRRDTRDPEGVGQELLAARQKKKNGKGVIVAKVKRPPMAIDEP